MKQMKVVMAFEFMTFVRGGGFIASAIILVLLAFIAPAVPRIIGFFGNMNIGTERRIAVVDASGHFAPATVQAHTGINASGFANIEAARYAINHGNYHYAVSLYEDHFTLYVPTMGMGVLTLGDNLAWMLREHHRSVAFTEAGVAPYIQAQILSFVPHSEIMTLNPDGSFFEDTAEDFFSNMALSYVLSFVLYFSLLMGGGYLMTVVIREKSTKTMDQLITSCKAGRLLNGKVLGVGAAVLILVLLMVGAAGLSMLLFGGGGGDGFLGMLNLRFDPFVMGMLVVFFLLGFLMYAYVYAALASMVSRMEDAGTMQTFPTWLVMGGFMASMFGLNNPGATWVHVLSHIPLFAPFVMFMRICLNTAAPWEITVSLIAQALTVCFIAYLSGRIYRMGTLMYGNKPKIKDILAALK